MASGQPDYTLEITPNGLYVYTTTPTDPFITSQVIGESFQRLIIRYDGSIAIGLGDHPVVGGLSVSTGSQLNINTRAGINLNPATASVDLYQAPFTGSKGLRIIQGTGTPGDAFQVLDSSLNELMTVNQYGHIYCSGYLEVAGGASIDTDTRFLILSYDSTAAASGVGGGIVFAGNYNSGGSSANFAGISGIKENATDGNYASAMIFTTRVNGGNLTERLRITSGGNVGIGTKTPGSRLAVSGLPVYASNAAAVTGGLAAGDFYRTGADPDPVCVVH